MRGEVPTVEFADFGVLSLVESGGHEAAIGQWQVPELLPLVVLTGHVALPVFGGTPSSRTVRLTV